MFSAGTYAPIRIPTPTSPSASEGNVEQALLTSNSDRDTEMLDARGKNPLSRTRGDSLGDDLQPPRKKTSPNTTGNNPLPAHNRDPSSNRRPDTQHSPGMNPRPTTKQTHARQPSQGPPPTPGGPPNQPQNAPPQQVQHPNPSPQQTPEPQEPPPGFTSAAEREEMRLFAAERTQTLARQAAARSAPNGDELEITPKPEQGFYCPEGLLSRWTIDNVKAAQVITVTSQPGAGLVIHIEGETSHDPNRAPHLAAGLARELKRILPLENPQVVPGIPATPPTKYSDAPYAYFVHGLTSNAYTKLTEQGAWRTRSMRFYAHRNGRAQLSFLGYIQGMSNLTAPRAMVEVIDFISEAFRTGEMAAAIRAIISRDQAVDMAGDEVIVGQEEVNEVIDKLHVERVDLAKGQNIPQPSINLYLMDANYTDEEWRLLRKAASKTVYVHDLHGVGRYFSGWTCALCHGVTHPTGMCPYLQVEDDIPMSDPIVPPHAKARQFTSDRRGSSTRGHNPSNNRGSRGRGGTPQGRR